MGRWDDAFVTGEVEGVVKRGLAGLIKIDVGVDEAKKELGRRAEGVVKFGEKFVGARVKVRLYHTNAIHLLTPFN